MNKVFSEATITDTIRVDKDLKFLNNYVKDQLNNGASEYDPPDEDDEDEGTRGGHSAAHGSKGIILQHATVLADSNSMAAQQSLSNINRNTNSNINNNNISNCYIV